MTEMQAHNLSLCQSNNTTVSTLDFPTRQSVKTKLGVRNMFVIFKQIGELSNTTAAMDFEKVYGHSPRTKILCSSLLPAVFIGEDVRQPAHNY